MNHEVAFQGFNEEVVITEYLEGFMDTVDVNRSVIISRNKHIVHIQWATKLFECWSLCQKLPYCLRIKIGKFIKILCNIL